jgi:hypothetical protein
VTDHSHSKSAAIKHAYRRAGKGICISCGTQVDSEARWPRCPPCYRQKRSNMDPETLHAQNQRRYLKERRAKLPGMCMWSCCREPAKDGFRSCQRHLDDNRLAQERCARKRRAALESKA